MLTFVVAHILSRVKGWHWFTQFCCWFSNEIFLRSINIPLWVELLAPLAQEKVNGQLMGTPSPPGGRVGWGCCVWCGGVEWTDIVRGWGEKGKLAKYCCISFFRVEGSRKDYFSSRPVSVKLFVFRVESSRKKIVGSARPALKLSFLGSKLS